MNFRIAVRLCRAGGKWSKTMTKSAPSIVSLLGIRGATTVLLAACVVSHAQAASLTALGDLPGGEFLSDAQGVSGDGSVVVGFSYSASGVEAFRWTSGGGMVGLGDLPGGAFHSLANGVSADGAVVVGNSDSASGFEAFRWTSGGGMVGLGDLPGGIFYSQATGVSGDGSVVVGNSNYDINTSTSDAFLWTSGAGMQRLWDVLVAQGVDPGLHGWTDLLRVHDISLDGTTIVGGGRRNGNYEAFVAVIAAVPEPASISLLLAGGLAGLGRRRGRVWAGPLVAVGNPHR